MPSHTLLEDPLLSRIFASSNPVYVAKQLPTFSAVLRGPLLDELSRETQWGCPAEVERAWKDWDPCAPKPECPFGRVQLPNHVFPVVLPTYRNIGIDRKSVV